MNPTMPRVKHGLSARLLVLTALFVMLSEIAIYVPSIARFRQVYLEERIASAHLATLVPLADPERELNPTLETQLLAHARLLEIELWDPPRSRLMLGVNQHVDATVDLRDETPLMAVREAMSTLLAKGGRVIRIVGTSPTEPGTIVEAILDENDLWQQMVDYSKRILTLSIIISVITAGLVYLSLQLLMVRSLRRITANLIAFREAPEDPANTIRPSTRSDELGLLERGVSRMQIELRESLAQKSRLAALGTAVSKINHDLRSILSTVSIASDRLARIDDPIVARFGPLLIKSVEQAAGLCIQTQDLARGEQIVPSRSRFILHDLVDEVMEALGAESGDGLEWRNNVEPAIELQADRERIYRVLLNLGRNAVQALQHNGVVSVDARRLESSVQVDVTDGGSGIPIDLQARLFQPFVSSGRSGGVGLGLVTARDLIRGHGGDLWLVYSGREGTCFRFELPER